MRELAEPERLRDVDVVAMNKIINIYDGADKNERLLHV